MRSNSLVKIICQTEARLLKLARRQRYREGLEIIQRFNRKYGPVNEILIQKAFFLYHYAAYLMYDHTQASKKKALIRQNFEQAINICKLLIKKLHNIDDRNLLNVRIYLAQIYAMIGRSKEAKNIARLTFNYCPSTLTSERAADVHLRLNDLHRAIFWYRKSIKLAKQIDEKVMAQIGLAVMYKQMGKTVVATRQARIASTLLKQADKSMGITLLGESLHAHFPNLDES